jgi:hypothetical protein
MFKGTILKLLAMAYILRDNPEGGGGGGVPERPEHVSEDEWEGLSTAEREALNETDEGEGAHQILGEGEDLPPDTDDLEEDVLAEIAGELPDEEEDTTTPPAPADDETAPPAAVTTTETTVDVSDEDLMAYRATVSDSELTFTEEVPADIQTKLDALDAKLDEAEGWFDEGEKPDETKFTRTDLNKISREVAREREAINREIMQHQIRQRDVQRDDAIWMKEQRAFFAARKDYSEVEADGKTLTIRADALYGAINQQVKRLNNIPANASKSGIQILIEADRAVRQAFGIPVASGKAPAPAAKPAAAPGKPPARVPNQPTLANVPVAEGEQVGNPFAAILRLSGEKYEKAIEKMSPSQQENFFSWADKQR